MRKLMSLSDCSKPLSAEESKELEGVFREIRVLAERWERECRMNQMRAAESAKKIFLR